ncbi:hypothetical protein BDV93DRAFT_542320 [Ceratobasidium sp. AG-I]|nr:hypothetical protein BDV93DRAFT_542320 [Ceratobasidium sp. AG-I]
MAGPSTTNTPAAARPRATSVKSEPGLTDASPPVAEPLSTSTSSRPNVSPKPRRSTRGTLSFLFAPKPERSRIVPDTTSQKADSSPLSPLSNVPALNPVETLDSHSVPKPARRRTNSRPTSRATLLGRSLTIRSRPASRIDSPSSPSTFPAIFASLPGRTRNSLRSSYEGRRSLERPDIFTLGEITPILDIPDPDTPTPNPHTFQVSEDSVDCESFTSPKRRSMASFARSPVTSNNSLRRASALPLGGGDDLFDPEVYRASTADLSDFLRDTGPEDIRGGPHGRKSTSAKDIDRDGASSTRSRTKSSIFRLGGRKREKSRANAVPARISNDLPPIPSLPAHDLPILRARGDSAGEVRTSFSQILPMLGLNEDTPSPPDIIGSAQNSLNGHLPPNTREHRLPDGTTILMITTPQASSEPKTLLHSKSLGSMTSLLQDQSSKPVVSTSNNMTASKVAESFKFQPQQLAAKPFVHPITTRLKTHSPNMSISSDGTLSTVDRPRPESGEQTSLLLDHSRSYGRQVVPQTPTTAQAVSSHSTMNMQTSYLQVHTPKSRPRGFSFPDPTSLDPISPESAASTPTVTTPTPGFSPSASIAPTPELTPQKSSPGPLGSLPMVKVDFVPPRKSSISSPVIVDGLQFPAPPEDAPVSKRRPTTMGTPGTRSVSASPSRTSKSMRVPRSPRLNQAGDESPKGRARKSELGMRPRPLDLGTVPSYREWKSNVPEVQVEPGELTGLELDLNEGTSEPNRKRNSLMEQHQQLFLQANPFQTPPSPSPSFPSLPLASMPFFPPPAGGPPTMPLPPSPSVLSIQPTLSYSPLSTPTLPEPRRLSVTPRRSRVDSLMIRSSMLLNSSPVSSPITSDPMTAVTSALSAQRAQFDGMSKYLIDVVKAFEEEKRAFEMRIQELAVAVAEKEAKAKEDERKIQGLEWLVGNLNLRAGGAQANNGNDHSDSGSSAAKAHRRRSSFSGLGLKDDMPITPLPMGRMVDANDRTKRTASMDDAFRNLIALSMPDGTIALEPRMSPPNIYEWAANTVLDQD